MTKANDQLQVAWERLQEAERLYEAAGNVVESAYVDYVEAHEAVYNNTYGIHELGVDTAFH